MYLKSNIALALAALMPASAISAPNNDVILGTWNGTAVYQAATGGSTAHVNNNIEVSLVIDENRRVVGASSENGCSFVGEYRVALAANEFPVKVRLSGCNYQAFNTKFDGTLTYFPSTKQLRLVLTRDESPSPRKVIHYVIGARLSRQSGIAR